MTNSLFPQSIFLASRSPRRRELLSQIGVQYELIDIEIDESVRESEKPIDYVNRMAWEKAQKGWQKLTAEMPNKVINKALLAADTSVVLNDKILGKPLNLNQAIEMLSQLAGNSHQVMTSVAIINKDWIKQAASVTKVHFGAMTEKEILAYCQSGEGADKAGGYAIQGIAAQHIKAIEGSYSGVVGLPLFETGELLKLHFGA
ncbi:Maf family protein [Aliikangiella coralliicola]|uniref:dTTP/UTP pyrophosphatase n=1 Tax=Aliikangiella coralliicola TaxID=2592383 RepID=A0A545UB28_9GAMM|nr:Maf family protein [Aliikangiella coralliicola]TQV86668.1 septum formation inhibitor Maf [Aliikangiella coralliicola]